MSQRNTFLAAAVLAGLSSLSAVAQSTRPAAAGDFSLTIYSTADPATFDPRQPVPYNNYGQPSVLPGYGVVREVRPIDLQRGENTLRFTDVAAGIDPTSVSFESLTAPDATGVLEQNFEFDLVSSQKLLEKYIDKAVRITVKPTGAMESAHVVEGTLLSSDGNTIVIATQLGVEILSRQDIASLKLEKNETGLITKPTLVWKVQSGTGGKQDAQRHLPNRRPHLAGGLQLHHQRGRHEARCRRVGDGAEQKRRELSRCEAEARGGRCAAHSAAAAEQPMDVSAARNDGQVDA